MSMDIPRVFYRFRPISRLLGQPATPGKFSEDGTCLEPARQAILGELEEGYIFASCPEDLNDPFEGYTKLYWAGDEIVWANLFKHYIYALGTHQIERMGGVEHQPIPIVLSRAPEFLVRVYEEVSELILANNRLQAHIRELSYKERKVTKEELHCQFVAMHSFITDRLFFVFAKHRIVPEYKSIIQGKEFQFSETLLELQKYNNKYNQSSDEVELKFVLIAQKYKNELFKRSIVEKRSGNQCSQLIDFPSLYVEQLPNLTHSPWYVACFMSSCKNSAIWGSYGDNHKGACLIFDTIPNDDNEPCLMLTVPWDKPDGLGSRKWRAKFQKVEYKNEPVELNFFETLYHLTRSELDYNWLTDRNKRISTASRGYGSNCTRDKYWDDLDVRLTRKWKDWAEEYEYRIVYNPSLPDASSPTYRKLKYEFSALKGICFGAKTSFEDIYQIINMIILLCEKHNKSEFYFHQVYHNPLTNTLEFLLLATLAELKNIEISINKKQRHYPDK